MGIDAEINASATAHSLEKVFPAIRRHYHQEKTATAGPAEFPCKGTRLDS